VGEYSAFFWFERERTVVGLLVCEECLTLLKPYKTDRKYRPMLNNNFSIIGYDYYEHEHGNDRLIHIILERRGGFRRVELHPITHPPMKGWLSEDLLIIARKTYVYSYVRRVEEVREAVRDYLRRQQSIIEFMRRVFGGEGQR
jgi:hypothetical protein